MKSLFYLLLFFISLSTFSQNNFEEVVFLKNGSVIRGTIIEQIPNVTLKIQTRDGSIFVYKFDEVQKITKEEVSVPASSVSNNKVAYSGFIQATIVNEVSSENEEEVIVQITSDVLDAKGNLLIKAGTPINSNIERTKKKALGRPGKIIITTNSVKAVNGSDIMLNGKYATNVKDNKGKVIGIGVGVGVTILWPMLAYLAKKGDEAIIPPNTIISNISIVK